MKNLKPRNITLSSEGELPTGDRGKKEARSPDSLQSSVSLL